MGENGAGKTTLLKLIMDQNSPVSGQRTAHRNLKFGYFSQHHVDQLDMTVCPVELMAQHFPGQWELIISFMYGTDKMRHFFQVTSQKSTVGCLDSLGLAATLPCNR